MTALDGSELQTATERERVPRGVRAIGCDLRVTDISFPLGPNGAPDFNGGHATVELRTDMWRFWLEEAIDAAVAADKAARQIPPLYEQFEAGEATAEDLDQLAIRELIATMRAITASAFAIDGFYASVKARSPRHPQQDDWNRKRTARHKQVADTFRVMLRINKPAAVKEIKHRVSQVFRFRDWAVHPAAGFRPPIYRPDLNVTLDWHFTVFRCENAVNATALTIALLDRLVSYMDRGSKELAEQKEGASRAMVATLDKYDAAGIFPVFERAQPPDGPGEDQALEVAKSVV